MGMQAVRWPTSSTPGPYSEPAVAEAIEPVVAVLQTQPLFASMPRAQHPASTLFAGRRPFRSASSAALPASTVAAAPGSIGAAAGVAAPATAAAGLAQPPA